MTTIIIRDSLRQAVEAASGGKQTVLYTAKGQPTYMNIITKKTIADLYPSMGLSDVHPAFKIGSQTLSRLYIGTYQSVIKNGELVSQPYQTVSLVQSQAQMAAAVANGSGHHLMTGAERGLLLGLMNANAFVPFSAGTYGTNSQGAAATLGKYSGVRVDGKEPGDTSAKSTIYTGSGPTQFRMNNEFNNISDILFGASTALTETSTTHNISGIFRVFADEIQVLADNSAATWVDWSKMTQNYTGSEWKAIDATMGALKDYTYNGTAGNFVATTDNSLRMSNPGPVNSNPTKSVQLYAGWNEARPANFVGIGQIVAAARNALAIHGVVPPDNFTTGGVNYFGTSYTGAGSSIAWPLLLNYTGPWGFGLNPTAFSANPLASMGLCRAAYYSASDLS